MCENINYNLDDIKLSGYKPRMGIELDGRTYEVEVNMKMKDSTKVAKTTAYYRFEGEVYEVKNYSKLAQLYEIFMDRWEEK